MLLDPICQGLLNIPVFDLLHPIRYCDENLAQRESPGILRSVLDTSTDRLAGDKSGLQ